MADQPLQGSSGASRWTRDQIEGAWDVFHQGGYALDRESMYYDEGADSEFCETHRRSLAVALDLAGAVPSSVAENLATAIESAIDDLGLLRGYVTGDDGWTLVNDAQREAMKALAAYRAAHPREGTTG